ncbi:hypothetical protein B005_2910 [Nocardiopsis alba ATCC BAA-2165]|uniref:Uncharacterized protein n=1 Tax=Nocardiopsis alba (strain ATCC BAA-2165 / BE74) TaxID=1205910 RepID=J7L7Y9_NOCAA|nr:hypothetical protein B005_2910 [Nocardiopsis alba ATCC BAA-2165]
MPRSPLPGYRRTVGPRTSGQVGMPRNAPSAPHDNTVLRPSRTLRIG